MTYGLDDDYKFLDGDDNVLEACGFRSEEAAMEHGENLARKHKFMIYVCKVIEIIDPAEVGGIK